MSIPITIPPGPVAEYANPGTPVRAKFQETSKGLEPVGQAVNALLGSKVPPSLVCDSFIAAELALTSSAALADEGYHYRFPTPWRLNWPGASTQADLYFWIRRTQGAVAGPWVYSVSLNGALVAATQEIRSGATGDGIWLAAENLTLNDTLAWQELVVTLDEFDLGPDNYCKGIFLIPKIPTSVPVIPFTGYRDGLRPAPVGHMAPYSATYTAALKAIRDGLIEVYCERQPIWATSARRFTDFRDGDPDQFVPARASKLRPTLPVGVTAIEYHVRARQVSGSSGGKVGVQGDPIASQEATPGASFGWHRFVVTVPGARQGFAPEIYLAAASVDVSALSVWAQRGTYS